MDTRIEELKNYIENSLDWEEKAQFIEKLRKLLSEKEEELSNYHWNS